MREYTTTNAEETFALGERLGRALRGRETIAFYGEPGAGKTVLSKGIARGLGVSGLVTSPTFTILNVYEGRAKLFHYDMYRISDPAELEEVGFYENLGEGVTLIEWSENIAAAIPADALRIRIEYAEGRRKIIFHEDFVF